MGERIFSVLDAYVAARPGRGTVAVLVALYDRRPPPKTRRWLRETLPGLVSQ